MVNQPDLLTWIGYIWKKIFKKLYCDDVFTELAWGSDRAKEVIENMKNLNSNNVNFSFYSSIADTQIKSFVSGCPDIPSSNYYFTVTEGHQSIVRAVKEHIVESCMNFISNPS